MSMSQARFNSTITGMTSAAQKVYEVVPQQEPWPTAKIASELQRTGVSMDFRVIGGCLNALSKAGLINETLAGYQREPVRAKTLKIVKEKEEEDTMKNKNLPTPAVTPPMPAVAAPAVSTLDRLGHLAQRAALMAQQMQDFQAQLKNLASDISDAAVDIQAASDAEREKYKKVRQMMALMKEVGDDLP